MLFAPCPPLPSRRLSAAVAGPCPIAPKADNYAEPADWCQRKTDSVRSPCFAQHRHRWKYALIRYCTFVKVDKLWPQWTIKPHSRETKPFTALPAQEALVPKQEMCKSLVDNGFWVVGHARHARCLIYDEAGAVLSVTLLGAETWEMGLAEASDGRRGQARKGD